MSSVSDTLCGARFRGAAWLGVQVFGYHEIFHALVVLASIFHFASVYMVVHGILPAARLAQA